jgi:hypothetical protein
MERYHKTDFVRVRPHGTLGDKGCDGYVLSTGRLYQCYGKIADAALNVSRTKAKILEDFGKAKKNFGSTMKEWHFVHNILDGLPSEVITTIGYLKANNPNYTFGLAGYEWFVDTIFSLPKSDIVEFLGPIATADQTHGLNLDEVRELLVGVTMHIDRVPIDEGAPGRVPVDKLEFNELARHWQAFIRSGSANAPNVEKYFKRHHNPEFGKIVAASYKNKYAALKKQCLVPDAIMSELYIQTAGNGTVPGERIVAVQAVLAYVFDACDIFEDCPEAVTGR